MSDSGRPSIVVELVATADPAPTISFVSRTPVGNRSATQRKCAGDQRLGGGHNKNGVSRDRRYAIADTGPCGTTIIGTEKSLVGVSREKMARFVLNNLGHTGCAGRTVDGFP